MLLRSICWVILFLSRIRFPPGKSLVQILTKRYKNNGSLAVFRKYQRAELKLGKAKLDLVFLKKCKQHDTPSRFLNFKQRFPKF